MTLWGYTCPECDAYHRTIDRYWRADGQLSIQCPRCGTIDHIQNNLKVPI